MKRFAFATIAALTCNLASTAPAHAQSIGVRGFGMVGSFTFSAEDSFKAILDKNSGVVFGGGGQVLLPWNIYVEIGAWRFKDEGERVFVTNNNEVFKLGIPVEITVTPIELTAGYRFRPVAQRVVPYAGVGYSSYRYKETSQFADPGENVDERFPGFHVLGGVEYQPVRWLGIGGELSWSSIADALGEGGVTEHYNEDNLGGASFRLKISVGR
jgi:opacity protein-like surface antigen